MRLIPTAGCLKSPGRTWPGLPLRGARDAQGKAVGRTQALPPAPAKMPIEMKVKEFL